MDALQIKKKILKKIRTGYADSSKLLYDKITFPADVKFDYMDDKKILIVHDVPITKEGVQQYGNDRHYKPYKEIENLKVDYSPISLSHPDKHFQDMTDAEVKELTVGWTNDSYFKDGKKYANFYHFVDRLEASDSGKEVLKRIESGKSVDVSMGFNAEFHDEPGKFDGKDYQIVQKNIVYDHVAELPFEQGRYSFPEGIGIGADKSMHIDIKEITNGVVLSMYSDDEFDKKTETYYSNESEANKALANMGLFDSKNKSNEVEDMENNVEKIVKIVQDSIKAEEDRKKVQDTLTGLQEDNTSLKKKVKELEDKNKDLEASKKELDEIKAEEAKKLEEEKDELTEEILKLDKDSEEIIEGMDNKKLQKYADKLKSFSGGKPSTGKKHPLSGAGKGGDEDSDIEELKENRKEIFGTGQKPNLKKQEKKVI